MDEAFEPVVKLFFWDNNVIAFLLKLTWPSTL